VLNYERADYNGILKIISSTVERKFEVKINKTSILHAADRCDYLLRATMIYKGVSFAVEWDGKAWINNFWLTQDYKDNSIVEEVVNKLSQIAAERFRQYDYKARRTINFWG